MDYTHNNKLIAEFMGKVHQGYPLLNHLNNYEYHSSWDWLMPVIEKISIMELEYLNVDEYFNPYPRTFGMQNEDGLFMFRFNAHSLHSHQNLIDAAYEAVVEFIELNFNEKSLLRK